MSSPLRQLTPRPSTGVDSAGTLGGDANQEPPSRGLEAANRPVDRGRGGGLPDSDAAAWVVVGSGAGGSLEPTSSLLSAFHSLGDGVARVAVWVRLTPDLPGRRGWFGGEEPGQA